MQKSRLINHWHEQGIIKDKRVLKAFSAIKREDFIPEEYKSQAYGDYPLPIGHEATISQPTTVVMMLQALNVKPGNKILEIGTGSGYNTALLSKLAGNKGKVITVEHIKELYEFAKNNLKKFRNVNVIHRDGKSGYEKCSPYDRIIVTASSQDIPQPLLNQLSLNGILVIPVGPLHSQEVLKITKLKKGIKKESLGSFVFVPLK